MQVIIGVYHLTYNANNVYLCIATRPGSRLPLDLLHINMIIILCYICVT